MTESSARIVLLLSGAMAAGKSAVAKELFDKHAFGSIRSGPHLSNLAKSQGGGTSRADLQRLGDQLDETTDFRWLIDDVALPAIEAGPVNGLWLLDSVRKHRQVEHFRAKFGPVILHVHLTAPEQVLESRYEERLKSAGAYAASTAYREAIQHPNEISSRSLSAIADLEIDLSSTAPEQAALKILEHWRKRDNYAAGRTD